MTTGQLIVILSSFTFTGFFIAWILIKFLFSPVRPVNLGFARLQGIFPRIQQRLATKAGQVVQSEFIAYKGLDEKLADPQLIAKLKPEIESHVDHFLHEKIKTVFPIIAQFMGEKTINQFKTALLSEIDSLLPVLLKNYSSELKNDIRLDVIVAEKINALSIPTIKQALYANAGKQINRFLLLATGIGFIMGLLTILLISSI